MKINALIFVLFIFSILLLTGCSKPLSSKACTEEAKICPGGSIVERVGPNCEFRACPEGKLVVNNCIAAERGRECPEEYTATCGWFNQSIKCIKYPCATTYANSCEACNDLKVDYWTQGPCPKTNAELQSACQNASGNWLAVSRECEGVSQEQCNLMNGEFNECASACRNDPNAEVCTLQCVIVCQFKN
jgi:hypothetical protein